MGQDSGTYAVGFQFIGKTEMYLADFSLCDVSQPDVSLLPVKNSSANLSGWRNDWDAAAEGSTPYVSGSSYTVNLLDYDASVFVPKLQFSAKMIFVQCTDPSGTPVFGQNVGLTKGKTYTISFRYKFTAGDMDSTVFLRVKVQLGSGRYTTYYGSRRRSFRVCPPERWRGWLAAWGLKTLPAARSAR